MTNLELITQNAQTLEDFLEAVQDDALEAEGCSYDLRLPPTIGQEEIAVTWKDWLGMEAEDEMKPIYKPKDAAAEYGDYAEMDKQ